MRRQPFIGPVGQGCRMGCQLHVKFTGARYKLLYGTIVLFGSRKSVCGSLFACASDPSRKKRNTHAPASVGGRFRQRQTPLRWTLAPLPHTPHRPHRGLRLEGLIPGHILSPLITWTDSVKPHQGTHLGRQGSRCSSTTRCVCPWARAINLAPRDLSACRSRDGFGMGHPSLRWMARCECLKFLLLHVAAPSMSNGPHHHA